MAKDPRGQGLAPQDLLNIGRARARGRRRTASIMLSIRPENKLVLKKWANELFLDSASDLVEYLCFKHQQGTLFITESNDFFAGMALSIEKRAAAKAIEVAEKTALRVLADKGLLDSSYLD